MIELLQGAKKLGIELSEESVGRFRSYYTFLDEKNRVMNLTAITGEKDVTELHFLDSLALLPFASFAGTTVIDIGSGAGFPGVPMKIAEPSIKLTLLDAQQKRVAFLKELSIRLQMEDIHCLHARAEETALLPDKREQYDFAVSRAVAGLNVLSELCLPFVKPGGTFIAMKAVDSDDEIKQAEQAFTKLGATLDKIEDYEIPGTEICHRAVMIRKVSATPPGYPRRFVKIQKAPL